MKKAHAFIVLGGIMTMVSLANLRTQLNEQIHLLATAVEQEDTQSVTWEPEDFAPTDNRFVPICDSCTRKDEHVPD